MCLVDNGRPPFLLFSSILHIFFDEKTLINTEKFDFNQQIACEAPVGWSKYTTFLSRSNSLVSKCLVITELQAVYKIVFFVLLVKPFSAILETVQHLSFCYTTVFFWLGTCTLRVLKVQANCSPKRFVLCVVPFCEHLACTFSIRKVHVTQPDSEREHT